MSLLRRAIALMVAGGLALGGLAAGGAFPSVQADARAPGGRSARPHSEPYGAAPGTRLADDLQVAGRPLDVSIFTTPDPVGEVLAFYQKAWETEGLKVVVLQDEGGNEGYVTTIDPQGWQRSVSAVLRNGQTLVLPAVTDGRRPPRIGGRPEVAQVPVPKEHENFLDFSSRDGDKKSYALQYMTKLSPDEVEAFYGEQMLARGYARGQASAPTKETRFLEFTAAGKQVTFTVQPLGEGKGCHVFAVLAEGGEK